MTMLFPLPDAPLPAPDAARQANAGTAVILGSLALLYHRHGDPARALALGLAAMQAGRITPELGLLVAASFLKTGDGQQTLATLSRFRDTPHRLSHDPDDTQWAACEMLTAKALYRIGDVAGAQAALTRAARADPDRADRRAAP